MTIICQQLLRASFDKCPARANAAERDPSPWRATDVQSQLIYKSCANVRVIVVRIIRWTEMDAVHFCRTRTCSRFMTECLEVFTRCTLLLGFLN